MILTSALPLRAHTVFDFYLVKRRRQSQNLLFNIFHSNTSYSISQGFSGLILTTQYLILNFTLEHDINGICMHYAKRKSQCTHSKLNFSQVCIDSFICVPDHTTYHERHFSASDFMIQMAVTILCPITLEMHGI